MANQTRFSFPQFVQTPLNSIISNASEEALGLICDMLKWDPQQRPTANQILNHPYFKGEMKLPASVSQTSTDDPRASTGAKLTDTLSTHNHPHHHHHHKSAQNPATDLWGSTIESEKSHHSTASLDSISAWDSYLNASSPTKDGHHGTNFKSNLTTTHEVHTHGHHQQQHGHHGQNHQNQRQVQGVGVRDSSPRVSLAGGSGRQNASLWDEPAKSEVSHSVNKVSNPAVPNAKSGFGNGHGGFGFSGGAAAVGVGNSNGNAPGHRDSTDGGAIRSNGLQGKATTNQFAHYRMGSNANLRKDQSKIGTIGNSIIGKNSDFAGASSSFAGSEVSNFSYGRHKM
eukprot:CAMPEP_0115034472 /NCGR_PEP_ID=MMETSP0216-20121206/40674_1 /TAXON_ID=223996 /ORGANISM="Protocruzia adherens, Strain Boccale" /LENGTH=340 /DNA_ID=CAMNT_0002413369 /DNA_START=128 /DNA_END=1150 /DNA_ORIENTATION=+